MKKKAYFLTIALALIMGIHLGAFAQMESDNYRIPTSVLSGGGAPMSSENWKTNSTLGQPTPLMQGDQNPWSANYDLYPGFWYTLEAGMAGCDNLSSFAQAYGSVSSDFNYNSQCDFDVDGDIDGSDLSDFIADYGL